MMVLDARALRIGRVPASREEEGHGAAAAAAGPQVGTRPAGLFRPLHVVPERRVGRGSLPAAFQVEDVVSAAGIEGAGRRRPPLAPARARIAAARMPGVALSAPKTRNGGSASMETLTCPKSVAARAANSSVTRAPFVVRFGVIPRARAAAAIASRSGRVSASPPPIAT